MDPAQRRWLVVNAVAVTAAINVVLNAGPAWIAARGLDTVPLWTVPFTGTGLYTDTLGTLLILPFVTTLLCTTAVRRDVRRGRLPALRPFPERIAGLAFLPHSRLLRALLLSAATTGLLAGPAAMALAVGAPDGLGQGAFIAYKTGLGVGLGLILTPLIALRAMADPVRSAPCPTASTSPTPTRPTS
jgi:hypothetical protein